MQCNKGHNNPSNAKFCGTCGSGLSGNSTQVQTTATQGLPQQFEDFFTKFVGVLRAQQGSGFPTNLQTTLAFISGALFGLSILIVSIYNGGESESPFAAGFWWACIGIVVVYLIARARPQELIVGATTAFIPLAATACAFLLRGQIAAGKTGSSFLLLGFASAIAWLAPILRGRPALLATSLLSSGLGLVLLLTQQSVVQALECAEDSYCLDDPQDLITESVSGAAIAQLVFGILLLGCAWAYDRRNWPLIGRTFVGVGTVFEISGAWGVAQSSSDDTAGAILLTVGGLLLIAVAVRRARKASLIIGGSGTLVGVVALISSITQNSEGPTTIVILLLLAAIGIGLVAVNKSTAIEAVFKRG